MSSFTARNINNVPGSALKRGRVWTHPSLPEPRFWPIEILVFEPEFGRIYIYICYSVLLEIIIRDRDPFIVRFRFQDFYSIVWNTEARVSRYSIRTSSPEVYANLSREGDVARRFHRVTVTSLSRKHADLRSMPRRWKLGKVGKKLSTDENFPRGRRTNFPGVRRNRSWRKRSRNRWRNRFPFIPLYMRVCMYQLERISVENSRDREQINRLVILTRSWPRRSREAHPLSFSLSFVRSSLRTFEFYSPVISRRKVLLRIWWRVNSKQRIPRIEDVMPGTKSGPAGNGNSWQISIQTLS